MNYDRDHMKKRAIKAKSNYYNYVYKKARNNVNKLNKETKAEYFQSVISSSKNIVLNKCGETSTKFLGKAL